MVACDWGREKEVEHEGREKEREHEGREIREQRHRMGQQSVQEEDEDDDVF